MAVDIQIGQIQRIGVPGGSNGWGFAITVRGRNVASILYQTEAEAKSARDTIEKALASAIDAISPLSR